MGILDSNKVLPFEKLITLTDLSLDTVGNICDEINTISYKEALITVRKLPSGGKVSFRGGEYQVSTWAPKLKFRNIYTPDVESYEVTIMGIYIVDLSNTSRIRFYNEVAVQDGEFTCDILLRQKSYSNELADISAQLNAINEKKKTVVIKSNLATITSGNNNVVAIPKMDLSDYRFYALLVRTMTSSSVVGYVSHSFVVTPCWDIAQATGETVTPNPVLTDSILIVDNGYQAFVGWQEIIGPKMLLYVKCTDSIAPTQENPAYIHFDLIGIR